MKSGRVNLKKEQIAEFCQKNHIKKFAFFGSVLRDDFRPDSDIDVLIDLDYSVPIGLMEIAGMEIELSKMIGREVDLSTPEDLSDYFRNKVLAQAEVLYER
jgi:predicted nucleotidyltransferase